jgi:hypothetical protein
MTTERDLIEYLETNLYTLVLASPLASIESRRRVQVDRARLARLRVRSIALYIAHGAACDTRNRLDANEQLEREGFFSYRQLLPRMRDRFPDVWVS